MKFLITGGNGFLGSNIVRKLILENHDVYAFSNNTNNITDILSKIQFDYGHTKDILNFEDKILSFYPDVVIHCGWSGGNNYNDVNDLNQFYENIEPSINLLNLLNKLPIKPKFIGFGSFSEYGDIITQVNELTKEKPANLYGLSKYTFKNYSRFLCETYNMDWVWIRPCYIYGPYDVNTRLVPLLINKFLKNQDIILDECNKTIDYLYIDDFVNFIYKLTTINNTGIYNICSGEQYNLKHIINQIHTLSNSNSIITFNPELNSNRKLTSSYICGDNTKITITTNIQPSTNLEEGILKTINFIKNK